MSRGRGVGRGRAVGGEERKMGEKGGKKEMKKTADEGSRCSALRRYAERRVGR
jgi:hypothetical protein